jgi:hypothetical protein
MPENLRTEGSWRNYFMRHACPASWPDKTICPKFYYGFEPKSLENVTIVTKSQGRIVICVTRLTYKLLP